RTPAGLMIPGRGEPVHDAVVLLDGAMIAYAGPAAAAPETPAATTVTTHTVMPGMWDCHAPLLGVRSVDPTPPATPVTPPPVRPGMGGCHAPLLAVRSMDLALVPQIPVPLRAARATTDL